MTSILTYVESSQRIFLLISSSSGYLDVVIVILFCFFIYAMVQASSKSIKVVHSHWHHMFETVPFKPTEFYDSLKKGIDEKGMEGISFSNITHHEKGILSAKRLYMRVKFREHIMDICAAPFAKEAFFVSWWLGGAGVTFRDVLITLPIIGKLFNRREMTFYEQDTEIMFKETIAGCVKQTIEDLTAVKGVRMSIQDWKGSDIQFKNK